MYRVSQKMVFSGKTVIATLKLIQNAKNEVFWKIQDIVKLRQGSARDGSQGERPQSLNPSLELTLKLVATTTTHHHPKVSIHLTNGQVLAR